MTLVFNTMKSKPVRRDLRQKTTDPEAKLAIELDGDSHFSDEGQEYDQQRTDFMNSAGVEVISFTNQEVKDNIQAVLETIAEKLNSAG